MEFIIREIITENGNTICVAEAEDGVIVTTMFPNSYNITSSILRTVFMHKYSMATKRTKPVNDFKFEVGARI